MRATRYRRHRITSPDLLVYTRLMAEDNGAELLRLRHALGHALRCLRYGGAALLRESFGEDGAENLRPPIDKRRSGVR